MLTVVRYGIAGVLFLAGIVILSFGGSDVRFEGWAMCWGSAFALLLISWLIRLGNEGDKDRDAEEAAREYLRTHGRWPDDP